MPDQDKKVFLCGWCGNSCDDTVRAIVSTQLSFITEGLAESGERQQKILYFCSRHHRVNYFYEP